MERKSDGVLWRTHFSLPAAITLNEAVPLTMSRCCFWGQLRGEGNKCIKTGLTALREGPALGAAAASVSCAADIVYYEAGYKHINLLSALFALRGMGVRGLGSGGGRSRKCEGNPWY